MSSIAIHVHVIDSVISSLGCTGQKQSLVVTANHTGFVGRHLTAMLIATIVSYQTQLVTDTETVRR